WGQVGTEQKIHWVSWYRLSLPQPEGGLGFRDFALFSQALLAKQGWRHMNNPDLVLTKVLRAMYFPFTSFLSLAGSLRPSYGWQSIVHGCILLRRGLRWQIGTGHLVEPCVDTWLPSDSRGTPLHLSGRYLRPPTVAKFISDGTWRQTELCQAFAPGSVTRILSIPLPRSPQDDCLIWNYTASGCYTTSSGYELLAAASPNSSGTARASPVSSHLWHSIWEVQVHPKLRLFLWKLFHRVLPTTEVLRVPDMTIPPNCPVCGGGFESVEHLLLHCPFATRFYALCQLTLPTLPVTHFVCYWQEILRSQYALAPIWVLAWWRLWKSRNLVVFDHT
ncbi:Uncharacterized mitochondrial protein AtMg00310, partial [Linum grandiflorum]